MSSIKVSLKVAGIGQLANQLVMAEVMPLLTQAVGAVAAQTRVEWQEAVLRAKLWDVERDQYAASITWRMTGPYAAEVSTDYKYAEEIENGRPARDLKKMLNTSEKVRRTKSGKRFLVIPFRHNLSGKGSHAAVMPSSVAKLAKAMAPSSVTSVGKRSAGEVMHLSPKTGMHRARQTPYLYNPQTKAHVMVDKRNYQWGGRLTAGALKAAGLSAEDRKRFAGMVRMNTSTPGGAKSSAMLTFRIMMEGQSGWVIPPQPGQYIAKQVTDAMQPKAEAAFTEAVKKTVTG